MTGLLMIRQELTSTITMKLKNDWMKLVVLVTTDDATDIDEVVDSMVCCEVRLVYTEVSVSEMSPYSSSSSKPYRCDRDFSL